MSRVGILTLTGIGVLVLLTSVSLFQELATSENELDARRTLSLLGQLATESTVMAGERSPLELARERPEVMRQLVDPRWLGDGRLVRHGYLFECAQTASAAGWVLHAWPLRYGRTGFKAYSLEPGQPLTVHENESTRWSGTERPPQTTNQPDS